MHALASVTDTGNVPTTEGKISSPNHRYQTMVGRRYSGDVSKYTKSVQRLVGTIREEWCDDVLAAQGFDLGDEYARSEYEPSKLFDALSVYDGESTWRFSDDGDWALLRRAISKVESYFKDFYGTLSPLKLDDDMWSVIKKETSSGLPSLAPKRMVFHDELKRAGWLLESERLDRLSGRKRSGIHESPEPCVAYYRTQASVSEDGTPKKKVRMVWGYPLSMILIEAMYARPAIDRILSAVTPITLGYRKSQLGALMKSTEWWPVCGTFDWSKWDANCPTRLSMEAFRIIRKLFKEVDDDAWNLITRYFATCGVVMPDGFSYNRRRKGIPSGSFFTSLVGSIANMIAIIFLAYKQGLDVIGIFVLGDDSDAGFTGDVNVGEMESDAKFHFGMKLNLDKLVYGGSKVKPHYLGHDWERGRITRPVIETAQRVKFPERFHKDWWNLREDKLISLYGDNVHAWPLIHKIMVAKRLATAWGSGDQFLLKQFHDLGGFTNTESPEKVGERKRFAAATFK